jgi:hypothetical protein
MAETQQERVPLADAWRLATGQEPPELTEQEIADIDAKVTRAREEAQRIYGQRPAAA